MRTEGGAFADALIEQARPSFKPLDNAFILELVYGVLRNRTRLDWTLDFFSELPVQETDAWTRNILRLGAYQMFFLDRVPASAAVNTSAELAKRRGKKTGYVNGLLRRLDRERGSVIYPGHDDVVKRFAVLHSHPEWLVWRWVVRYGAETTATLLAANNVQAPLILRTNTLKTTREGLKASLESEGARVRESRYSPVGLELVSSPGLQSLSAFRDGRFIIQDEAAQLVGMLLSPQPGETVLDACAAPGGKATHLAEMMRDQGVIIALESDEGRIGRIRENSRRLGTSSISPVKGDAKTYNEGKYDKILIDAPCSGLGVLRRHPDGRWHKNEKDIEERSALQKDIIKNCSRLLKPGGALVYATCTTEPEENEDVVNDFFSGNPEFTLDDPRPFLPASAAKLVDTKGFFRTCPAEPGMDGFFGARMVRK